VPVAERKREDSKVKRKRQLPVAESVLLLILAVLLLVTGCTLVRSESDVLGEYELKVGNGKIALKVSPDRSFSETIFWPTGRVESRSGQWLWNKNRVSFDQLWIPSVFAPDYILRADESANKQPKYTVSGHWAIQPEKHWGTVVLPIFPDADVNFKMIRQFHQQ
jgi:hypothetical protein